MALHGPGRLMDYLITVSIKSDMGLELVQALAESMLDDPMFAMHEVAELTVMVDD